MQPFPLNPSFNPPPPVNARFRDELWKLHSENPQANNVRALSSRFSIGPDRVLAILRLKALEKEMTADVSFCARWWAWPWVMRKSQISISLEDLTMVKTALLCLTRSSWVIQGPKG
jgi:Eukaryotic mitochondrial regulator protein